MNLPTLITLSRLLLVPFTVWLIISDAYGFAFLAFMVAGVSDAVDGYIARRFGMTSELGAYLDPLADKALLVSVYVTLAMLKVVPAWLAILVVSRDVLIVGAIVLSQLIGRPVSVRPLMVSKVNTAVQIVLVVAVLASKAMDRDFGAALSMTMAAAAILTAASGAAYLLEWIRHMAHPGGDTA